MLRGGDERLPMYERPTSGGFQKDAVLLLLPSRTVTQSSDYKQT